MNCKPVIALCSLFYNTRSVVCKRLEDGSDLSKETYEMCESGQAQRVCERLTLLEAQIKELEQTITKECKADNDIERLKTIPGGWR